MTKVILYFNYLSSFEEKSYCRDPSAIGGLLESNVHDISNISVFSNLCKEETGADLVTELCRMRLIEDPMLGRFIQFYLHLAIFEILKRQFEIVAVAGYSAGYWLASVACGLYEPHYFKSVVTPIMMKYRNSNWAAWERDELSSMFLFHPDYDCVSSTVKQWLATPDCIGKVRVKDDRPPHAIQIAGLRKEVEQIAELAYEEFPGLGQYSTRPRRSDAAHINWSDHTSLLNKLRTTAMHPPTCPIISSDGKVFPVGARQSSAGVDLLFNAVFQPLCMTKLASALRKFSLPVLAIGSERVTRFSFYGLCERDRPEHVAVWQGSNAHGELPAALAFSNAPVW